ncbi:hypothetical protein E2P81_ATG01860 [Venturia nashicola]|nr:hypothetical protein E2P81_ATG01860 [Venturia nashicola]
MLLWWWNGERYSWVEGNDWTTPIARVIVGKLQLPRPGTKEGTTDPLTVNTKQNQATDIVSRFGLLTPDSQKRSVLTSTPTRVHFHEYTYTSTPTVHLHDYTSKIEQSFSPLLSSFHKPDTRSHQGSKIEFQSPRLCWKKNDRFVMTAGTPGDDITLQYFEKFQQTAIVSLTEGRIPKLSLALLNSNAAQKKGIDESYGADSSPTENGKSNIMPNTFTPHASTIPTRFIKNLRARTVVVNRIPGRSYGKGRGPLAIDTSLRTIHDGDQIRSEHISFQCHSQYSWVVHKVTSTTKDVPNRTAYIKKQNSGTPAEE